MSPKQEVTCYRYTDRDSHGRMAPENTEKRIQLQTINVPVGGPTSWMIDLEQFSPDLAEAKLRFLKLKMSELADHDRETGLIHLSIKEMLDK